MPDFKVSRKLDRIVRGSSLRRLPPGCVRRENEAARGRESGRVARSAIGFDSGSMRRVLARAGPASVVFVLF